MKRSLLGLAAVAWVAIALPAAAAESAAAGAFQAYCSAMGGGGEKALAAADAAGWAPIPDSMMDSIGSAGSMKLSSGGARAMVIDRKLIMLLAGRGLMDKAEADFCAIISFSLEAEAVRRDIRALTGVEPIKNGPPDMKGVSMWVFMDGPNGREYLPDINSRKAIKALSEGRLSMLMAGDQSGMTMVMQMRPEMPE